ncbi:MAG: PIN domain-containing protein [Campylobacterota bacterium]|nr:PIN domain-containing protein [Campylobacterota bacterium]
MPNNIYIDTNIIIDICDDKRPYHEASLKEIITLQKEMNELYINSDTYANLFYILRSRSKYTLDRVLSKMRLISSIFTLATIEHDDIENAIQLCEDKQTPCTDYEDTMQYVCAKKISADLIVTNDKGFIGLDIEVRGAL